jgi:ATP-dependent DNA helicase RecG
MREGSDTYKMVWYLIYDDMMFPVKNSSMFLEGIMVAFFDDRIEIENPGILLPGMTIDDVKQGVSKIRNRVIARVFRELSLIEQWGSGFPRILQEAEKPGLRYPVIEEIGMRVRVTIFLAESHRI